MRSAIFATAARNWQEMRRDFDRFLLAEYNQALIETGGVLVNKRGRALHIDGLSLFTGPEVRARRYASEELIEWWNRHPRKSMTQYEQEWIWENM
jgi:hypothetical protein